MSSELDNEITNLDSHDKRIVMTCITEGIDIRAYKEAITLKNANNQVIMLRRSLSGYKPVEIVDEIIFVSTPAICNAKDLITALRNKNIARSFSLVNLINLWALAYLASLFNYSFATARIEKKYHHRITKLINFFAKYTIRIWHIISVYKLYQCEYIAPLLLLKPDIIHAHDLYMLRLSIAAAKITKASCVYDAHELESNRNQNVKKILSYFVINEEKKFAPKADAVITVSPMIAELMRENLNINQPCLILNSPILGKTKYQSIRQKLKIKKSTPLVIFVGKIFDIFQHDHKIGMLIEAVAKLPNVHLALVGPMSINAKNQIKKLVAKLKCSEKIHLVKIVPAEQLVSFIRDADVGAIVMPPHTKNIDLAMPNKLFEYLLADLSIVSFDNKQIRSLIAPLNRGVFVNKLEANSLSNGILKALEIKKSFKNSSGLHSDIIWEYSWAAQADKLINLYNSLPIFNKS